MKLEHVSLAGLVTYASWTDAPIGRLLQVTFVPKEGAPHPFIAMRCEFPKLPLSGMAWLVGLLGGDAGVLLSSEDIGRTPALDLTDLVEEVGVAEPLPVRPQHKASHPGVILQHEEFVVLDAQAPGGVKGYVPLIANDHLAPGKIVEEFPFPWLVLGRPSVSLRKQGQE